MFAGSRLLLPVHINFITETIKAQIDQIYILIQQKAHLFDQEPRWLEKGEKNTSYKRQMISSLKIDDVITSNPKVISNYVESFYSQLYKSIFQN